MFLSFQHAENQSHEAKWHKNQHSARNSNVQDVNIVESDVNSESVVNSDQTPVAVNPNPTFFFFLLSLGLAVLPERSCLKLGLITR